MDAKYRTFREPRAALPDSARARYAQIAVIELEPAGRILSWDNAGLTRSAEDGRS